MQNVELEKLQLLKYYDMKITTVFILLTLLSVMYSCSDEQVIFQEPEQPEQPEQPVESVPEPESSLPMLTVVGRYLKNIGSARIFVLRLSKLIKMPYCVWVVW